MRTKSIGRRPPWRANARSWGKGSCHLRGPCTERHGLDRPSRRGCLGTKVPPSSRAHEPTRPGTNRREPLLPARMSPKQICAQRRPSSCLHARAKTREIARGTHPSSRRRVSCSSSSRTQKCTFARNSSSFRRAGNSVGTTSTSRAIASASRLRCIQRDDPRLSAHR